LSEQRLIQLGVITTVHGVRGQVKIRSFTAIPEDITSYGPLRDKSGRVYDIRVTGQTKDVLIATIKDVETREAAEKLRGTELWVPRSALPDTQEHSYYYEDLAGLKLLTADGTAYGIIEGMYNFGAGDLVAVKRESGKEELIPFSRTTFPEIHISKGTAIIDPPVIVSDE
jgi:16S rRNA processing protein RimM